MSLTSLTCSQSVLFSSSNPPHTSSPISQTFSSNRNLVFLRNRLHAKSDTNTTPEDASSSTGGGGGSPSTSFLSVLCPLLKLFSGGDPSRERNYTLEVATSSLSTLARFPWGSRSLSEGLPSQEMNNSDSPMRLQLFEFGSVRHREMVRKFGGKEQFPFLIDPNTGITMYESGDIVNYLFQQYGKGRSPSPGLLESTLITGWMPTILRAGRGMSLWEKAKGDPPPKKLELFSYENNPYARIVREALCELELPYILHNVGEGSSRTKLFLDASGSKEVPYLIDPNTGTQIGDYKKILSYLFQTYSASTVTV